MELEQTPSATIDLAEIVDAINRKHEEREVAQASDGFMLRPVCGVESMQDSEASAAILSPAATRAAPDYLQSALELRKENTAS